MDDIGSIPAAGDGLGGVWSCLRATDNHCDSVPGRLALVADPCIGVGYLPGIGGHPDRHYPHTLSDPAQKKNKILWSVSQECWLHA